MEQQTLAQVERDRAWKDWNDRVDAFKKQASTLDTQVQAAEEASRAAKRAQESYLELNQKLERRINEITEIQRLADERSRQEWVAFKAEDQKRWTSYTLSQDESIRELRAAVASAEERVGTFEDLVQTAQDQLHQTTDAIESQMQELMNWAHEWLTSSERIMGHGKKTTAKASKTNR
jgi:chaperonin cofactor prefoldin